MFLGVFVFCSLGTGWQLWVQSWQIHKTLQNSNHFANAKGFEQKKTFPSSTPLGIMKLCCLRFFFWWGGCVQLRDVCSWLVLRNESSPYRSVLCFSLIRLKHMNSMALLVELNGTIIYTLYIQTLPWKLFAPPKHTLDTFSRGVWMFKVWFIIMSTGGDNGHWASCTWSLPISASFSRSRMLDEETKSMKARENVQDFQTLRIAGCNIISPWGLPGPYTCS